MEGVCESSRLKRSKQNRRDRGNAQRQPASAKNFPTKAQAMASTSQSIIVELSFNLVEYGKHGRRRERPARKMADTYMHPRDVLNSSSSIWPCDIQCRNVGRLESRSSHSCEKLQTHVNNEPAMSPVSSCSQEQQHFLCRWDKSYPALIKVLYLADYYRGLFSSGEPTSRRRYCTNSTRSMTMIFRSSVL